MLLKFKYSIILPTVVEVKMRKMNAHYRKLFRKQSGKQYNSTRSLCCDEAKKLEQTNSKNGVAAGGLIFNGVDDTYPIVTYAIIR